MTRGNDLVRFENQPWAPARITPPLSADFTTAGPRLIALVERHFRLPDGGLIRLDDWQKALICHILETYPADWPDVELAGRLRFRQAVVSMARQNGKSILGAIFALWGLLQHTAGPSVVGLATSVEQANVVYARVRYAVDNDPALKRRLKATGTRGIAHRDGRGNYQVKPALAEGVQSVPITVAIADELHLMHRQLWDSIVQGQRAQADALIAGFTTAGDETSELLLHLYDVGARAIAGHRERFFFAVWEAPEGATIWTPGAMEAASPAIASGRITLDTARADVQDQPTPAQDRYALNRFVAAAADWFPLDAWASAPLVELDTAGRVIFGISKTPAWEWASIVAATKLDDGQLAAELVATVGAPTMDALLEECEQLARFDAAFVLDSAALSGLGKELRERGHEVYILTQNEVCQASANIFAAITKGRLGHDHQALALHQWQRARRTISGESWRISSRGGNADVVLAMTMATWIADTKADNRGQLWV